MEYTPDKIKCVRCNANKNADYFPLKKGEKRYLTCLKCRGLVDNETPTFRQRVVSTETSIEELKLELDYVKSKLTDYTKLDNKGLVYERKPRKGFYCFTWYLENWNDVVEARERVDLDIYEQLPMQSEERIKYLKKAKAFNFQLSVEVARAFTERNGMLPARARIPTDIFNENHVGKKNVYSFDDEDFIFNIIRSHLHKKPLYVRPTPPASDQN